MRILHSGDSSRTRPPVGEEGEEVTVTHTAVAVERSKNPSGPAIHPKSHSDTSKKGSRTSLTGWTAESRMAQEGDRAGMVSAVHTKHRRVSMKKLTALLAIVFCVFLIAPPEVTPMVPA